jgi:hypothetical protein
MIAGRFWTFKADKRSTRRYLSKGFREALAPPDTLDQARRDGARLISLCREVQQRERLSTSPVSFQREGARLHPALAEVLALPQNRGALRVLQAAARLPAIA